MGGLETGRAGGRRKPGDQPGVTPEIPVYNDHELIQYSTATLPQVANI